MASQSSIPKYAIQTTFNGYRHKEDLTNIIPVDRSGGGSMGEPSGTMIPGSQNVLTNDGERIAIRGGMTLDGQSNKAQTPIISSFDWFDRAGGARNLRAYNDNLEYRYDNNGTITWNTLYTGFGDKANFNFVDFWDNNQKISEIIGVNGTNNMYAWTGALATFSSATSSSITIQGTQTIAELGFTLPATGLTDMTVTPYFLVGSVETVLTGGTTHYSYAIVAVVNGETTNAISYSIPNGGPNLDTDNFNRIDFTAISGATAYKIYRIQSGGTPSSTGLLDTITPVAGFPQVYKDFGGKADGTSLPKPASVTIQGTSYSYLGTGAVDQKDDIHDGSIAFGEPAGAGSGHKIAIAQSFVPTVDRITGVSIFRQNDTGTFFGTIEVRIAKDNAGVPGVVIIQSGAMSSEVWKTFGNNFVNFSTQIGTLIPGELYWIEVTLAANGVAGNFPNVGIDTTGSYTQGTLKYRDAIPGPVSWVTVPGQSLSFETFGYNSKDTTTLSGFTFTGVLPDPSVPGYSAGTLIQQDLRVIDSANITGLGLPTYDLIGILTNQVYVGSLTNRQVFISKVNNFSDFSFSSPREPGEGAIVYLDNAPEGFIVQEQSMYISGGLSDWYQIVFQLSSDLMQESLSIQKLKTNVQQAAIAQAAITKDQNSIVFLTQEKTLTTLGRIQLIETPQNVNISDSIKFDLLSYDDTNASIFYFQNFYLASYPVENLWRMFNLRKGWWEAPQIGAISRFAIINGELYGHSAIFPETYKLFNGTNDLGNAIEAKVALSYWGFGQRALLKNFNELYVEGYISPNTELQVDILYDYQGSRGTITKTIDGADSSILFGVDTDGSLGKQSLGTFNLGGSGDEDTTGLPSKFRVIKVMQKNDFYEQQVQFSTNQMDANWQLLGYGMNVMDSTALPVSIKQ